MPNRLISGEWEAAFLHLFHQAEAEFVMVSPFLGREPVEALRDALCRREQGERIRVRCVVNCSSDHLLDGSVDSEAMALLAKDCPQADIFHLGGLHAKVYIADQKTALITSANFTWSGWRRNREVGVWLEEPNMVREAYQWVSAIQEISTPLEPGRGRFKPISSAKWRVGKTATPHTFQRTKGQCGLNTRSSDTGTFALSTGGTANREEH